MVREATAEMGKLRRKRRLLPFPSYISLYAVG
jgi:hypothetical protein